MAKQTSSIKLPALPYDYADLAPIISKEQLTMHHAKHHQAYVDNTNKLFELLQSTRKAGTELDSKAFSKALSFNYGGHLLHTLFWENMIAPKQFKKPGASITRLIKQEFGSFERFQTEFSNLAVSTEGSGWATLVYDKETDRLLLNQIEKHNVNLISDLKAVLVLDVWEHAYYLDYGSNRKDFVANFWQIVNWAKVEERIKE